MNIPHTTKHLLHQPRTLRFRIMIIRLFVQPIEQFSPQTQFLHQINLAVRFVHLLQSHYIGMIELTHYVNFFSQLLEALFGVDESEIEAFDGVF